MRQGVAAVGTVVAMVLVGLLAAHGRPTDVALGTAAAFVPWAGLLLWPIEMDEQRAVRVAIALAAIAGFALVIAPSVLSEDVYRYVWDGRVLRHGISPYRYAPDDPALAALRDEGWRRINNPEIPTIYPPLAQALFAVAAAPWVMKTLALAAHLATIPVVARLAKSGAAALA